MQREDVSNWQPASVVINEGDEAYTTNLCQKCFNEDLQAKGEKLLTNGAVERGGVKGGVSVKDVENDGMWEHFSCERSKAKKFRELADEEKQAGIQGQWQQESPAKEYLEQVKWYLEQVKCCHDTDMKKGFTVLENGTWEENEGTFRKKMKASEWLKRRSIWQHRTRQKR